jgi:DNA-binding response OmpR family regulator
MVVLVVESNEHVRDAVALVLTTEGYEVVVAAHGLEALHVLRRRSDIDLVLSDVMMPFLTAWRMRRKTPSASHLPVVPVIMMTGGLTAPNPADGVAVLQKPFDMTDLLDAVRSQLGGRSRRSSPARRRRATSEQVAKSAKPKKTA